MSTINPTRPGNGRAWIMLLLASAFEIGYALSVGGSQAFTVPAGRSPPRCSSC